jgi:hypothetical protein
MSLWPEAESRVKGGRVIDRSRTNSYRPEHVSDVHRHSHCSFSSLQLLLCSSHSAHDKRALIMQVRVYCATET